MKTETEFEIEAMKDRVALHPFLVGMNRTQLALLADCALAVQFKKNQVIFCEGEPANRFYLIETGKVILVKLTNEGGPVAFPAHRVPVAFLSVQRLALVGSSVQRLALASSAALTALGVEE